MLLFVVIAVPLFLASCGHNQSPSADAASATATPPASAPIPTGEVILPLDAPQLKQIKIQPVAVMNVADDEVISPGRIETNPNRISHVVPPIAGRATQVFVKLGDSVQQGQPLLELESAEAEAAESSYLQAQAAVAQAKAAQIKAQADFYRASDLFQNNAVPKKDVLAAENALTQVKASVDHANAGREQALRRLQILGLKPGMFNQKVTVMAPIPGKILEMSVVGGEYRNDTNASLMTIANLSSVWVTSEVPESSIRFYRIGGSVAVELVAYPDEKFYARVTHISDTVDPQMRTVKVRAELDNPAGRFRPDMSGRVLYSEAVRPRPAVPEGAILRSEGRTMVYVQVKPGHFVPREVRLGKQHGNSFVIHAGLQPKELVVIEGAIYLRGGI